MSVSLHWAAYVMSYRWCVCVVSLSIIVKACVVHTGVGSNNFSYRYYYKCYYSWWRSESKVLIDRPTRERQMVFVCKWRKITAADLGFGKGGCPIHQKGVPEGAKPRHARQSRTPAGGLGASPRKFENLDTLWFIFPAFQGITNCVIECAFMTIFNSPELVAKNEKKQTN